MRALPEEIPVTVIGLGSNLLVRDGGVPGVVVRLSARGFGRVSVDGNRIRVGAAMADKRLAAQALEAGLGGFAFYHGIPGGIGGALRMNAGANGVETSRARGRGRPPSTGAASATCSPTPTWATPIATPQRPTISSSSRRFTRVVPRTAKKSARRWMRCRTHRETAQPVKSRTGGSTFKNPDPPGTPNQRSAWRLIDAAGCRGLRIGDAQVSEMHCNFLINTGAATGHDLELLGETVRARVLEHSGVRLEWEIKRIGRFQTRMDVEPFLGADR